MAVPKVFVSSTCFDLGEVREQLSQFIESYGFDPVLSENGDVFFHPDLHTHEACVHEVSNCQLFILIIGGRFGGEYTADTGKSITNMEYKVARDKNIPVFTYVKQGVLADHYLYVKNRKKDFLDEIEFPNIEQQKYAVNIFNFMDEVRKSPTNNAYEDFKSFGDIEQHLRKQWAGMFFDFLKAREVKKQIDATNHLVEGINDTSNRLEELVKRLFRSSNVEEADKQIEDVEVTSLTEKFFEIVLEDFLDETVWEFDKIDTTEISSTDPLNESWHSYLVKIGLYEYDESYKESLRIKPAVSMTETEVWWFLRIEADENFSNESLFENGVKKTTPQQRAEILLKVINRLK